MNEDYAIISDMIEYALLKKQEDRKNHICFLGHIGNKYSGTIGYNSSSSLHRSLIPLHAEMDCIKKHSYKMSKWRKRKCDVDLISLRVRKDGTLANSQPCYHCATELYKHKKIKIRNIYYCLDDGKIQKYRFTEWYKNVNHYITSGWATKLKERND